VVWQSLYSLPFPQNPNLIPPFYPLSSDVGVESSFQISLLRGAVPRFEVAFQERENPTGLLLTSNSYGNCSVVSLQEGFFDISKRLTSTPSLPIFPISADEVMQVHFCPPTSLLCPPPPSDSYPSHPLHFHLPTFHLPSPHPYSVSLPFLSSSFLPAPSPFFFPSLITALL